MFLTCSEITINVSVALLLAAFTTYHAFQIEVHHRFTLALGVTFCLAIASDCKFFHKILSFTCGSRPHQAAKN